MTRRLPLALLLTLGLASPSWAAVTLDTHAQSVVMTTTPITTASYTVNNASPLVLSCHWSGSMTLTSVVSSTSGSMTALKAVKGATNTSNTSVYILTNPTTGAQTFTFTFSANPSAGARCFWYGTAGGDTTTGVRTVYSRTGTSGTGGDSTGAGPGLTVSDSQNGDLVFHAATVSATTIVFTAPEVTDATSQDDAIGGSAPSGGFSTQTASGANTTVDCTDQTNYSEVAFAVFAAGGGGSTAVQQSSGFLGAILP